MSFSKDTISDCLNWLLSVLELVIVLAIACLVGFGVYCLLSGSAQEARVVQLIKIINENWKAALVLLIPLFYRPIRMFLERLEQGPFGMRTGKPVPTEEEQKENP